jgi:hypothetical protein
MRLIKIRISEWRDGEGPTPELVAAARLVAETAEREAAARRELVEADELMELADTEAHRAARAARTAAVLNAVAARNAARSAEAAAGEAATRAMKSHPRVGTHGYQILTDDGTAVGRVVDEDGKDLPAGAVYGYLVVDQAPAVPSWAKGVSDA